MPHLLVLVDKVVAGKAGTAGLAWKKLDIDVFQYQWFRFALMGVFVGVPRRHALGQNVVLSQPFIANILVSNTFT